MIERNTKQPKNRTEGECYDYMTEQGWYCTKRGYPDFFCNKDGEICFIEVKPNDCHTLKSDQIFFMNAMSKLGVPCYKYTHDKKLIPWEDISQREEASREQKQFEENKNNPAYMKRQALLLLNSLITDDTTKKELDMIAFIKKCVNEFKTEENKPIVDWQKYFEKLWKLWPRKVNKELAKRTFEHKIRGLNEQECKDKCNSIYKAQMIQQQRWQQNKTEMCYISHYSSWLNNAVPNSPHYKGK